MLKLSALAVMLCLIYLPVFAQDQPQKQETASKVDACSILSKAEVEQVLDEQVKEPKRVGSAEIEATAQNAAISNCTFESTKTADSKPAKSLFVWIRKSPASYNDANSVLDSFLKDPVSGAQREMTGLDGVGEAAYWKSEKIGDQPRVELDARKQDVVVQVVLTGIKDAIEAQTKAKEVAEKVFAKLVLEK